MAFHSAIDKLNRRNPVFLFTMHMITRYEKAFLWLIGSFAIPLALALPVILVNDPMVNLSVLFNMPQYYALSRFLCLLAYLVFLRLVYRIQPSLMRYAYATGMFTLLCLLIPYGHSQPLDTLHVLFAYAALAFAHATGTLALMKKPALHAFLQAALMTSMAICFIYGGICGPAESLYGIALSITLSNANS